MAWREAESATRPVLDDAALTGLPGDFVRTIAPHTEADPAALLVQFLVGFGNAVGPGPFAMADGSRHEPRLYVVIVGPTSRARKGTAWRHVRNTIGEADPGWARRDIAGGLASGEGLIAALRDQAGADGIPGTDKRLLAVEEEFARVMAASGRDGSTLSHVLRQAWDGGDLHVLTRKDPIRVSGSFVSVIGHATTAELVRTMTRTDVANGFANRFIYVFSERSKLLPDGGSLQEDEISRLVRLTRSALEDARSVAEMRRTDEAAELWRDLYAQIAEEEASETVGAVTSRAEAQILRLSLVYALADRSGSIDATRLSAAWAMWRYCVDSAELVFGSLVGDATAQRLLEGIEAAGPDGLSFTEQGDLFGRHLDSATLRAARAMLEEGGYIRNEDQATKGRNRGVSYFVTRSPRRARKAGEAKKRWRGPHR